MKFKLTTIQTGLGLLTLLISIPLVPTHSQATSYSNIDNMLTNPNTKKNPEDEIVHSSEAEIIDELKKACRVLAAGKQSDSMLLLTESMPDLSENPRVALIENLRNKDIRNIQVADDFITFSFKRDNVVTIAALEKEFGEYEPGFDTFSSPLNLTFKYSPSELSPKSYKIQIWYATKNGQERDPFKIPDVSDVSILSIDVKQD
jgi:hypothetical protein